MKQRNSAHEGEYEPSRSHLQFIRKAIASMALFASAASLGDGRSDDRSDLLASPDAPVIVQTSDSVKSLTSESFPLHYPASAELTKGDPEYCQIVDMTLPRQFDYSEILKGAQTEFVVSNDEYHHLEKELQVAATLQEMENVLQPVIQELGVEVHFNDSMATESDRAQRKMGSTLVDRYRQGSETLLRGLARLPRQAMHGYLREIDLTAADSLVGSNGESAGGLYFWGTRKIELPMLGLSEENVVHEVAHMLQRKACEGRSDSEMKYEYDEAVTLYHQLNNVRGRDAIDQDSEEAGFPTKYSHKADRELFAELAMALIVKGSYITDPNPTVEQSEVAQRLKDIVVKRLQRAMPGLDVNAYLQYVDAFKTQPPYELNPAEVSANHVSLYDRTFTVAEGNHEMLSPAIIIRHPGTPDQTVYALTMTNNGITTVDVYLRFPTGTTVEMQAALEQAARDYLAKLPVTGTKNLMTDKSLEGDEPMSHFMLEARTS